ncbi:MAG: 30S ribosomal protein S12 methylthiotransferase RimO [Clostridia bacterium]|nr:30S ribosomal protein S12 methylthiotransferase RimO [Clostridia bacterium]
MAFSPEKIKTAIVSLGCAKNLVDSELMLGKLRERGFETVAGTEDADVIIVNTCAFIEEAREEAINTILELAELKKSGKRRLLVVAGCLAQRYSEEIKAELPEVDAIVGINSVDEIADVVEKAWDDAPGKVEEAVSDNYGVSYMNGPRVLSTPAGSAYLKIAEGCDNRCSFCAIPLIRGRMRSRTPEDIVSEAKELAAGGVREVNIIAQDTTKYGKDLFGEPRLSMLLKELDKIEGLELIRLLYLYPDEIDDELIDTIASSKKIAHYIDLPLQHISDALLKKMNRRGDSAHVKNVISKLKAKMPDCIIRTTFIVGFPGETEEDFEELLSFVGDYDFDRIGVFKYSPEEGTPAAKMTGQVPEKVKQERYDILYSVAQSISHLKNINRIGQIVRVITEGVSEDGIFYYGRSYAEAPDSDGKIFFTSEEPLEEGDIVEVELLIAEDYDMTGKAIGSSNGSVTEN